VTGIIILKTPSRKEKIKTEIEIIKNEKKNVL
jgi:hypothetical protein